MQIPSQLNYTQAFAGPFRPTPPGTVVQVTPLLGLGGPFPGNAGPFVTPPRGYDGFGADAATKPPVAVVEPVKLVPVTAPKVPAEDTSGTLHTLNKIAGYAGYLGGAFHGYKRTESVGWAFGWALFGGLIWPLAIPVMLAQGFGKPIAKTATANRKAKRNAKRRLTPEQKKALADYNYAIKQEDRYLGSVFVTPIRQRDYEARTKAAYDRCEALGMGPEHGL